jgi:hypothetical protein
VGGPPRAECRPCCTPQGASDLVPCQAAPQHLALQTYAVQQVQLWSHDKLDSRTNVTCAPACRLC